jgi:hypothetical protein
VRLSATTVEVLDGATVVARHSRAASKYAEALILDHYLEVLKIKPGRCPARPRWRRPRHAARSPGRLSATGTPPAVSAATRPAPAR